MDKSYIKFYITIIFLLMNFVIITEQYNLIHSDINENSQIIYPSDLENPYFRVTDVVSIENGLGRALEPYMISDDEGNLHIVYSDTTEYGGGGTDMDIFYKYWNSTIDQWSIPILISSDSVGDCYYPNIIIDYERNKHIFWSSFDGMWNIGSRRIFHRIWNNSQNSWLEIKIIANHSQWQYPVLDKAGNIHLVWNYYDEINNDSDTHYSYWNSTTNIWNQTELITSEFENDSWFNSLAIDSDGNKHIVWEDKTDYLGSGSDMDIFYRMWNASTRTWNNSLLISSGSNASSQIGTNSMLIDRLNNLHITWSDEGYAEDFGTNRPHIFYIVRNFTSNEWSDIERITTDDFYGDSLNPVIANDNNDNIFIVWDDNTPDFVGQIEQGKDIYYRSYNKNMNTWGEKIYKISGEGEVNNQYDSLEPTVVCDRNNNLHVAWADELNYLGSSEYFDIFYRGIIFNNTAPKLNQPPDILYEFNGTTISWIINDTTVDQASYTIKINGTYYIEGTWKPQEEITIDIKRQLGIWNYSIIVFDGINAYDRDNVIVEIIRIGVKSELISLESDLRSYRPKILVDNEGVIHMVWNEKGNVLDSGADCDIIYRQYNPMSGISKMFVVSSETSRAYASSFDFIIDPNRLIHFTWASDENIPKWNSGWDHDIYYRTYDIDSDLWSATEFVSNALGNNGESGLPDIDIDSQFNVHIVWMDESNINGAGEDYDIFYKYKNAQTQIWSDTEIISNTDYDSNLPHVKNFDNGSKIIVWDEYNSAGWPFYILFKFYNASEGSWGPITWINSHTNRTAYENDVVIDSSGNLHIVWSDTTNLLNAGTDHDIFYFFQDFETGEAKTILVTYFSDRGSRNPKLTVDDNGVGHIVYEEDVTFYGDSEDVDIVYVNLDPNTLIVNADQISTESTSHCGFPAISLDDLGNLHIIYEDSSDIMGAGLDWDIFYKLIIVNNTYPEIQGQEKIYYEYSTRGHQTEWYISDRTVYSGTYKILRNGDLIEEGNWTSGTTISINVDDLSVGLWNFTIIIDDGIYGISQYSNFVEVGPLVTPYIIATIIIIAICIIVIGILLYFKKKGYILSQNALNVFISHSDKDFKAFNVGDLAKNLNKLKVVENTVFYEKHMKGNLIEWMENNVPVSQILIFIATKNSLDSKGCAYELKLAIDNNVSIIPILAKDIYFTDLQKLNDKQYQIEKNRFTLENLDLDKRFGLKMPYLEDGNLDFDKLLSQIKEEINKFQLELDKVMIEFKKSDLIFTSVAEKNLAINKKDIYLDIKYLIQLNKLKGAWNQDKTEFLSKKEIKHRIDLLRNTKEFENDEDMILSAGFHQDSIEYILTII